MPMKKLLVAVVGEGDTVESLLSPQAAAKLAKAACREQLFQRFAAEVVKGSELEPEQAAPHSLVLGVMDETGTLLDGGVSAKAVAKLLEQHQKEQLFLDFAAEIAHEAKRLTKLMNQRQQLALSWFNEVDDDPAA